MPCAHEDTVRDILESHFGWTGDFTAVRLGGLTNYNYLIEAGDLCAVFRLPGEGTEGLVDRAIERDITQAASDIGVDNELLYFDPETGIKAVAYIPDAETMSPESMREPDNIVLAAKLLAKLHEQARPVDFRFDVFEMIPHYEKLIAEKETFSWEGYDEMRAALYEWQPKLASGGTALCHCDPLCENFVKDPGSGRMYMIDWEYGGMNDPLWDVADVIIESGYDAQERSLFQDSYFGRPATTDEDERISINIVLIDFLWALWGKQRSYFDHSLDNYGPMRFARAKENFAELVSAAHDAQGA